MFLGKFRLVQESNLVFHAGEGLSEAGASRSSRQGISPKCQQCPWTIRSNKAFFFFFPSLPNPSYLLEPDAFFSAGISKRGRPGTLLQSERWWSPSDFCFFRHMEMQLFPCYWKGLPGTLLEVLSRHLLLSIAGIALRVCAQRAANFAHLTQLYLTSGCRLVWQINSAFSFVYASSIFFLIMLSIWVCYPPFYNVYFI